MTMATGDHSAMHAVALFQSLRDSGTQAGLVALLSRGGLGSSNCNNRTWLEERNRLFGAKCGSAGASAEEITSQRFLDAFSRLNVEVVVIDPVPSTNYTPAGRNYGW